MSEAFNIAGVRHTVQRFSMYEGDDVTIPAGAVILASEVVSEVKTGELKVEVWAAVASGASVSLREETFQSQSVNIAGTPVGNYEVPTDILELGAEYAMVTSEELEEADGRWGSDYDDDYLDEEEEDDDES